MLLALSLVSGSDDLHKYKSEVESCYELNTLLVFSKSLLATEDHVDIVCVMYYTFFHKSVQWVFIVS